ncbi:hypothetical protein WME76_12230 [Sorangium sp. So ce119]|uniref:hypothetical protein n=1 Tax=Sorangium sp. So ce119 TaxID=3133279 RepID=UPI003F5F4D40
MLIAVTTILTRDAWWNEAISVASRLLLLKLILGMTRDAQVLLLPGGFLRVERESDIDGVLVDVEAVLEGYYQAVLWGMDVADESKKTGKDDCGPDPHLPFYAFLRLADGSKPLWRARQLAASSQQAVYFSALPTDRVVRVGSQTIGILLCGEMLAGVYGRGRTTRWTRDMVRRADVVLDVAHADVAVGGSRNWTWAIEKCADAQPSSRPVMVAQHLAMSRLDTVKWGAMGQAPRVASQTVLRRHVGRREVRPGGQPEAIVDLYDVGCA